jgi:hypothetical protein
MQGMLQRCEEAASQYDWRPFIFGGCVMGKARKKRRRRGYPPRRVYEELHRYAALFLETLTLAEQKVFRQHMSDDLTPKERLQILREDPLPDELLLKFQHFLEEQEPSKEFLRHFHIRPAEKVAT